MILLFTSQNCTWCDTLKMMISDEIRRLPEIQSILEIDIDRCRKIAETYGILIVPTLVARGHVISGLPSLDDLRSFFMRAISECVANSDSHRKAVFGELLELREKKPVLTPLSESEINVNADHVPDTNNHIKELNQRFEQRPAIDTD